MLKKIDYLPFLESCWQEHLAPRESNAPTVISTFAGCGGSSLGYSMAGFRELLAIEWDDNAVATFKLNFPDVPIYHGDIAKISVEQILEMTGLKVGELDVFDGSPPCQGFSTAGKRQFTDDRNQLFLEFSQLLRGLQPKVFVMENVSGMVKGKMKIIFAEILRELKSCGYKVSARLLNAMYFNVPQSRQRLIFIGVRNDLGIETSHPKAESRPFTVKDAIEDLKGNKEDDRYLGELLQKVSKIQPDLWEMDRQRYRFIKGNIAGAIGTKWAGWNRVCGAIIKSEIAMCGTIHPDRERYLSVQETQRIFSFPDKYIFIGDRKNRIARMGNSVPPLFMRAIAKHIRGLLADIQADTGDGS
jgi:DNA (cytosine-5)-methyltransferase 1